MSMIGYILGNRPSMTARLRTRVSEKCCRGVDHVQHHCTASVSNITNPGHVGKPSLHWVRGVKHHRSSG